ncbi:glycosyltransferase [Komagataeibacter swingsii]|uniref:Glycosyltransferase n=2 Tax=Komagataeibacter swingsii TaxID=215220 RepID=A0A2V4S2W9_9PROT|nr:glycosyltransferase [Komagataeibacter swingsii]GBQ59556.1 WecB/TagA/CpsF family glycosyl transferase [Komagataeibacter swingsii DSM 16373]
MINIDKKVFGLHFDMLTERGVASMVLSTVCKPDDGVQLVVTPNIQHISLLEKNEDFRRAYASARIVTCDGFPLYYYARMRRVPIIGRVTGRGIVEALLADPARLASQRLFLVVPDQETQNAVVSWAGRNGLTHAVRTIIPSCGFVDNDAECRQLAHEITQFAPTILLLCVGAPQSEVFVGRYRALLPACWALCIGQGVKVALGLVRGAPRWVQAANLEWLWRILQEPRRLAWRYAVSAAGFLRAMCKDIAQGRT